MTSDEEPDRNLTHLFDVIQEWHDRVVDTPKPVQPGSELDEDDAALAPFQLSHGAHQSLFVAVDHLHALRTLVVDAKWLHSNAPFTLVRGGLENGATALWMLGPDDPVERRLRRLRNVLADAKDAKDVYELIGEDASWTDERRADVLAIATRRGLTEQQLGTRLPGYEAIVVSAQKHLGSKGLQLAYKGTSGLGHGRSWASLGLLRRELHGDPVGDMQTVGFNADLPTLYTALTAAVAVTQRAWKLYDRRRLKWTTSFL